ncbi:MAG: C1 family peptidase, partial [Prevotellaceae bacterium]|nr:C1 family peptidase [Prevotellaceae bacterium]
PKLDQKITDNAIVAQISPELDNFIDTLSAELQAFLTTNNFSLPQKRAALASLLGEDDELFSGNPYDKNIPIIDDCEYEAANIFVEFHNHINSCDDLRNAYAALANIADTGHVKLPLNEIKSLKIKIKNSTQTIRKLTAQMEEAQNLLDGNNMSSKVLIDGDVFTIGDEHFKILPTPVEKPLEETYEPKNQQLPQEIDLREKFTAIKNQGEIGSCTAFSSVGVYEYLAKRKERILNLSESFVYYYARTYQNNQNEDTGSSIHDAIIAMTEYGVCERSDWDYTTENIHQEPSQIAKDNAKNNTVTKALNVKHSINDFKSAISEGYPVCFSMKIFKSFGESHKGFITKPNAAELQSTSGYHAMVMCGYSDTNKVFIVRNSWGENFGDKGYCYIPYSYIEDEQLCSSAFLIKEISIGQAFKNVINNNNTVNFDLTDNYIRFAIARNLLEEEKHSCAINEKLYAEYRIKYYQITSALSNIAIREKLRDGESRYIGIQIDKDKTKEHELREEKAEKLNMFKGLAKKTAIYILCIIGLMLVSFYSVLTIKGFIKTVFSEYFLYNVAGIALLIGILIIAWKYYKYKLRKIESEWNEKIDEIGYKIKKKEQERDGLNLRSHIAGMIHDKIFSLKDIISKKHKIMKSYVLNLLQWYNEETDKQILMNNNDNLPFINIIENDLLDDYFNNEKDNISSGINLYDFINNYALTEDGIIQFKKDLENNIKQILDNSVSNFRMYDYIASITNYPYLNNDINNIYQLMNKMIKQMSQIFLRPKPFALNKDGVNFICVNNNGITHPNWNTALTNTFATLPEQLNLCLQNKIVIVQIIEFDTDELQIMV